MLHGTEYFARLMRLAKSTAQVICVAAGRGDCHMPSGDPREGAPCSHCTVLKLKHSRRELCGMRSLGARHDSKLHLHLILHCERAEQGRKGRKPEVGLLQRKLTLR
jgi:hypothetical protein